MRRLPLPTLLLCACALAMGGCSQFAQPMAQPEAIPPSGYSMARIGQAAAVRIALAHANRPGHGPWESEGTAQLYRDPLGCYWTVLVVKGPVEKEQPDGTIQLTGLNGAGMTEVYVDVDATTGAILSKPHVSL